MQERQPSRTALGAAAHRAAHQRHVGGRIFHDPFAHVVLGADADRIISELAGDPAARSLQLFIAARSRFAEDCFAAAVERGVRQAVVLGAGLDTMSLRQPHGGVGLRIYEVDHPATQQWKRNRLAEAGLTAPTTVTFVAVDFEKDDLGSTLAMAGLRSDAPAFFTWLGVVPYLHREAVIGTLRTIASIPNSEVVFDYTEPLENYDGIARARLSAVAERTAAIGEPWLTFFDPAEVEELLHGLGFGHQEDLGLAQIDIRYLGVRPEASRKRPGPHVLHALRRQTSHGG
jgi:methyltransferase (TIGR00027 family)